MRNLFKNIYLGFFVFSAIKAASVETPCVIVFDANRTRQEKTIPQFVEDYWQNSRLRFLGSDEGDKIKAILLKMQKWPGGNVIKAYEQLYWNRTDQNKFDIFKHLLDYKYRFEWREFKDLKRRYPKMCDKLKAVICLYFSKSEQTEFIEWMAFFGIRTESNCISSEQAVALANVYKKFSDPTYCEYIMSWYHTFNGIENFQTHALGKILCAHLIYQKFSSDDERESFKIWVDRSTLIKKKSVDTFRFLKYLYADFDCDEKREDFVRWANHYHTESSTSDYQLLNLVTIYCAFDTDKEREHFIMWAKEIQFACSKNIPGLSELKNIYCALKTNEERDLFKIWSEKNQFKNSTSLDDLSNFKEIYFAFDTQEERNRFAAWTDQEPISLLRNIHQEHSWKESSSSHLLNLKNVYCTFINDEERNRFLTWFSESLLSIIQLKINIISSGNLLNYLKIYSAFDLDVNRNHIFMWIKECDESLFTEDDQYLEKILIIFKDTNARSKFDQFTLMMRHYREDLIQNTLIIDSFISQNTIKFMRLIAALLTEPNASNSRKRAIYETDIDTPLPALNPRDLLMQQVVLEAGLQNAHTLETYYERDAVLLNRIVNSRRYNDALAQRTLMLYDSQEVINCNYQTNLSVMDFIHYLETEFKTDQHPIEIGGHSIPVDTAVDLVKELLGILPRNLSSGMYGPYLSRPMLYGRPTPITGDILLGQIWHLVKTSTPEPNSQQSLKSNEAESLIQESDTRKRSVVLALLNGIDFNYGGMFCNCQTRITGELLEMACFHLGEESILRRFVASEDDVLKSTFDMKQRIQQAQIKATRIFNAVKESESYKELYSISDTPELYELYLCYYDALYGGKSIMRADGVLERRRNEHILEKNELGHMVRRYHADGSVRDNPEIVYYQAEFAILEHQFTNLLVQELNEKRGLIY
ncbi:MAG: hypothetical protein HEEMFOPI_01391 [Holosporales bacterium]